MDEITLQERIAEVTEWLETHEIDDADYVDKFGELQQLEMRLEYEQE